jgi:hypothetical protein
MRVRPPPRRAREIGSAAADGYNKRRVRGGGRSAAAGQGETTAMAFDPYWEWLQIPHDRRPADFYALLGLPPFESDPENIRLAGIQRTAQVRKFCLGQHGPDATRLLGELAQAFSCLADPPRKQSYDDSLRTAEVPAAGALADQRRDLGDDAPPPLHSLPPRVGDRIACETDGDLEKERFEREVPFSPGRPVIRSTAARWTSRKHYRKHAADRKLVLLVAGCALLASTIAVLSRQKSASQVSTDSPASVQAAIAEQQADEAAEPAIEETPSPRISPEPPPDMQSEKRPQPQPSDAAAEKPAPEPNLAPRPPQETAQIDPPAPSNQNRAPAAVLAQSPGSESASGAGPDAEADAQRREQEEEQQAQELLKLGLNASSSGKLNDALGYFIDAIEKARYRNAPVTTEAAKELDNAWRSLNVRSQKGKLAREARKVWLDFHNRLLEHPPPQPAGNR